MKILISGGSGFIGRRICELCRRNGDDYLSLTLHYSGLSNDIVVDLLNKKELEKAIGEFNPDVVIHLAALAAPVHSNILEVYETNIIGTENLMEAITQNAVNCKRVVFVSTAGVYGNQDPLYLSEELKYSPVNHYSYSKVVDECIVSRYRDRLDVRILRPFTVVGKGQNANFFVPKVVKAFREKKAELRVGNLDSERDYVDVDFVAKTLFKVATCEQMNYDVLNICSGKAYSCLQVIELLTDITGHKPDIISDKKYVRNNEIWRLVGDPGRLNSFVDSDFFVRDLREILIEMLG